MTIQENNETGIKPSLRDLFLYDHFQNVGLSQDPKSLFIKYSGERPSEKSGAIYDAIDSKIIAPQLGALYFRVAADFGLMSSAAKEAAEDLCTASRFILYEGGEFVSFDSTDHWGRGNYHEKRYGHLGDRINCVKKLKSFTLPGLMNYLDWKVRDSREHDSCPTRDNLKILPSDGVDELRKLDAECKKIASSLPSRKEIERKSVRDGVIPTARIIDSRGLSQGRRM